MFLLRAADKAARQAEQSRCTGATNHIGPLDDIIVENVGEVLLQGCISAIHGGNVPHARKMEAKRVAWP